MNSREDAPRLFDDLSVLTLKFLHKKQKQLLSETMNHRFTALTHVKDSLSEANMLKPASYAEFGLDSFIKLLGCGSAALGVRLVSSPKYYVRARP
jgi:hypothetical protein